MAQCEVKIPTSVPVDCVQVLVEQVTNGTLLENWKQNFHVASWVLNYVVNLLPEGEQPMAVAAPYTEKEALDVLGDLANPSGPQMILGDGVKRMLVNYLFNLVEQLIRKQLGI